MPPSVRIWSAGSEPTLQVNPLAVKVMAEVGIDIAMHRPKRISDVPLGDVDRAITLCAEEECAVLPPELERTSWALTDPARADDEGAFRRVRDELKRRVEELIASW
jgi:protein-tyrosine-phosphatase